MESEREVLLHGRQPHSIYLVCCSDLWLGRPCEDIQVNTAAKETPSDICWPQKYLLAIYAEIRVSISCKEEKVDRKIDFGRRKVL